MLLLTAIDITRMVNMYSVTPCERMYDAICVVNVFNFIIWKYIKINVKYVLPINIQSKLLVLVTELISYVNKICYIENEGKRSLYPIIH